MAVSLHALLVAVVQSVQALESGVLDDWSSLDKGRPEVGGNAPMLKARFACSELPPPLEPLVRRRA